MNLVDQDFEMVRHYLASRGLGGDFISSIHEADEMYSVLVKGMGNPPDVAMVSYFDTGRALLRTVEETLAQTGRDLRSMDCVLELACGYGRLTRHMIREIPASRITTVDIQKPAIAFQREVMGTNGILSSTNPDTVPLEGPFDLIVVVSLFSHLPLHRFEQWLVRLHGLLAPDGILLFSVHPHEVIEEPRRDPSGFTFEPLRSETNQIADEDLESDLEEYGGTYATEAAVREIAERCGVANLRCLERGLVDFQDLYLVSPSSFPELASWRKARWMKGFIDYATLLDDQRLRIGGWVVDTGRGEPVRELRVWVDGKALEGEAILGAPRPDVAQVESRPDFLESGWSITAPLPVGREGRHCIMAEVDGIGFDCRWMEIVPAAPGSTPGSR